MYRYNRTVFDDKQTVAQKKINNQDKRMYKNTENYLIPLVK